MMYLEYEERLKMGINGIFQNWKRIMKWDMIQVYNGINIFEEIDGSVIPSENNTRVDCCNWIRLKRSQFDQRIETTTVISGM